MEDTVLTMKKISFLIHGHLAGKLKGLKEYDKNFISLLLKSVLIWIRSCVCCTISTFVFILLCTMQSTRIPNQVCLSFTVWSYRNAAATLKPFTGENCYQEKIHYIFIERNHKPILHTSVQALTINQIGNHSK